VIQWAQQTGTTVVTLLTQDFPKLVDDVLYNMVSQLPFIGNGLANALKGTAGPAIVDMLTTGVGSLITPGLLAGQKIAGPAFPVLLGLDILKLIIKAFRSVHFGVNFGLQANVNLDFEIRWLEALLEYLENYAYPTHIVGFGEVAELYKYNQISAGHADCLVKMNGGSLDLFQATIMARREKLHREELIEYMRRNGLSNDQIIDALRSYGYVMYEEASAAVALYDKLPGRADFLHYLQRNVFDTEYVKDYNLLEGFDDRYWANFGTMLQAIGVTYEVSQLDYASHWINPAPEQLRRFVHRLRPDKYDETLRFTTVDYERLLAEQDVAPYFQGRFVETVYNVPALGYIRDMYRNYVISDDQLKGFHQDLGYSPSDSDNFVSIDKLVRARMRASEGHGWTPAAMAAAFSVGQLDQDFINGRMADLGFTYDETSDMLSRAASEFQRSVIVRARSRMLFQAVSTVRQSLESGILSDQDASQALQQMGWPQVFADGWVSLQRIASNAKLVKEGTRRIRSAFLAGEIDLNYVGVSLATLGIRPESIAQYQSLWSLELTPNRKRRTASQIVNDLAYGEISIADALVRLTNLGYEDADRRLYLADAQRKILRLEAQAISTEARQEREAAKEQERIAREASRQSREALAALRRISPPTKMQTWAKRGLIGRDTFYERMRTYGYDDPDIQRWWDEACPAGSNGCLETSPAIEGPPANISGSGFPTNGTS
jgi:hypothetical protein